MKLNHEKLKYIDKISYKEQYYYFCWLRKSRLVNYKGLLLFFLIAMLAMLILVIYVINKIFGVYQGILYLMNALSDLNEIINKNENKDIYIMVVDASAIIITGAILTYNSNYKNTKIYGLNFSNLTSIQVKLIIIFIGTIILFWASFFNLFSAMVIDCLLLILSIYILIIYENKYINRIQENIGKYWLKLFYQNRLDVIGMPYNDKTYVMALRDTKIAHENILNIFESIMYRYSAFFSKNSIFFKICLLIDENANETCFKLKKLFFEQFYSLFSGTMDSINIEFEQFKISNSIRFHESEIIYSFYYRCFKIICNSKYLSIHEKMLLISTMFIKLLDCSEEINKDLNKKWLKEIKNIQIKDEKDSKYLLGYHNLIVFLFVVHLNIKYDSLQAKQLLNADEENEKIPRTIIENYFFDFVKENENTDDNIIKFKPQIIENLKLIYKYNLPDDREFDMRIKEFSMDVANSNIHKKEMIEIVQAFETRGD